MVTLCPNEAATLAASIPAGPLPITATRCFLEVSFASCSDSFPTSALTEQDTGLINSAALPEHPSQHRIQGQMSSRLPSSTFLTKKGSAIRGLAIETKSACPL